MNYTCYNGCYGYSNEVDRQWHIDLLVYSTAPISDLYPILRRNYTSKYANNLMPRYLLPSHYMLGGATNKRFSSIDLSPKYNRNSRDYPNMTHVISTPNRNQRMPSLISLGCNSIVVKYELSENGIQKSHESSNRQLNISLFRHKTGNAKNEVPSIASMYHRTNSILSMDDGSNNYVCQRAPDTLLYCCDDVETIVGAINNERKSLLEWSALNRGILQPSNDKVTSASVKTLSENTPLHRRLPNETLWEIVQFLSYAECERNATVSRVLTHLIAPRMRLRIKMLLKQIEKAKKELHVTNDLIAKRQVQISTLNGQILDMNDRLAGMSGRLGAMNEQIVESHQRIDNLLKRLRSIRFCDEGKTK